MSAQLRRRSFNVERVGAPGSVINPSSYKWLLVSDSKHMLWKNSIYANDLKAIKDYLSTTKSGLNQLMNMYYRLNLTPLMWASMNGKDAIVKLLLAQAEIDVNIKDSHGKTALIYACIYDEVEVVSTLLKSDEIIVLNSQDDHGWTALMYCCAYKCNIASIKMLIEYGADIDIADKCGYTALSYTRSKKILKLFGIGKNSSVENIKRSIKMELLPVETLQHKWEIAKSKMPLKYRTNKKQDDIPRLPPHTLRESAISMTSIPESNTTITTKFLIGISILHSTFK